MTPFEQERSGESCPLSGRLRSFCAGDLDTREFEELAQHVEGCQACQERIAELDQAEGESIDRLVKVAEAMPFVDESNCGRAVDRLKDEATDETWTADAALEEPPSGLQASCETLGKPGDRLGEYELVARLGEGAMGAVYRGQHVEFNTVYAIKLIHPKRKTDQVSIERFQREMEAVGRLNHPNIVRAIDAGQEGDVHYLVMEYVDGTDLSRLSFHRRLRVAEACELVRQAALALDYVHRHGRVHRDVKPSNLMLAVDGNVKLLDLGLARINEVMADESKSVLNLDAVLDSSFTEIELTQTHQAMGTLAYMAPEQASDSHTVDGRADIYSLGCTLYKLLAGRPPFGDSQYKTTFSQIMAHAREPVPPICDLRPDVSDALAEIIERMLAKNPDDRFATAAEVATALEPFVSGANLQPLIDHSYGQSEAETDEEVVPTRGVEVVRGSAVAERTAGQSTARRRILAIVLASAVVCCSLVALGIVIASRGSWYSDLTAVSDPRPSTTDVETHTGVVQETTSDEPIPAPPGEPVDLLALIDLERDARQGDWTMQDGALVANKEQDAYLYIPYSPPDAYRIEATVERRSGSEGPQFGMVIGDEQSLLAIDGFANWGFLSGPFFVDNQKLYSQPRLGHRGRVLLDATPVRLACSVCWEGGEVVLAGEANNRELFRWRGPATRAAVRDSYRQPASPLPYLRTYYSELAITALTLTPLVGHGHVLNFADKQSEPDRAAAQRLLWKGGRVTISETGSTKEVVHLSDLPDSFSIERLYLPQGQWLSPADLAFLSNLGNLRELDLSGRRLADTALELQGLNLLEVLDLSGTDVTESQLSDLRTSQNLRQLDLGGAAIGDEAAATIGQLTALQHLRLSQTAITDAGLQELAGLTELTHLDLAHTHVTNAGIETLASLPKLEFISFNGVSITDQSVERLAELQNLRRIHLLGTDVTRTGIERLEQAMPQCDIVHGFGPVDLLEVADVDWGAVSGEWHMEDGTLVSPDTKQAKLQLPVVPPDEYDLEALVRRRSGDRALTFGVTSGGYQANVGFDHYPTEGPFAILQRVDGKSGPDSEATVRCDGLSVGEDVRIKIQVRRGSIGIEANGDSVLNWVGDFDRLTAAGDHGLPDLRLLGINTNESQFAIPEWTLTPLNAPVRSVPFRPTPATSELELVQRIHELGGEVVVTLGWNTQSLTRQDTLPEEPLWVREITVPEGVHLTAEDFELLRQTWGLEALRLNGTEFDAGLLAQLADLKWLKILELNDTEVDDDAMAHVARLPWLRNLRISRTEVTDAGLTQMVGKVNLRLLDAAEMELTDVGLEAIAAMQRLAFLNVSGNSITTTGLTQLTQLPNLQSLILRDMVAVNGELLDFLAQSGTIHTLDLSHTNSDDETAEQLAGIATLRILRLAGTKITDQGLRSLRNLKDLIEIDLQGTAVTDASVVSIGQLKSLKRIDLQDTRFSDDGIVHLFTIRAYEIESSLTSPVRQFVGHTAPVNSLAVSSDGKRLLSASDDDTVRLWDIEAGEEIARFEGHTDDALDVAFAPDGQTFFSAGADGSVRQWDIEGKTERRTFNHFPAEAHRIAVSPDGRLLLVATMENDKKMVRMWDVVAGTQIQEFQGLTTGGGRFPTLQFTWDGNEFIHSGPSRTWCIRESASGREIRRIPRPPDTRGGVLSRDGRMLLAGNASGLRQSQGTTLVDLATGRVERRWLGALPEIGFRHDAGVSAVAMTNNDDYGVFGYVWPKIALFDLASSRPLLIYWGHTMPVSSIQILPDGRHMVSAARRIFSWEKRKIPGDDHVIRLWRLPDFVVAP